MKIALISTYNRRCGVAQFSRYWAKDLVDRGCEVQIFADEEFSGFPPIPEPYEDLSYFRAFPTGHNQNRGKLDIVRLTKLIAWADVLLVSYQSFLYPWIRSLEIFRTVGIKTKFVAYLHDTYLSDDFFRVSWDRILVPKIFSAHFNLLQNRKIITDQPIPISPECQVSKDEYPTGIVMGYGRNRLENIIPYCEENNFTCLKILIPSDDVLNSYAKLIRQAKIPIRKIIGYQSEAALANHVQSAHFAFLDYPNLNGGLATSSAIRFLIGTKTPIIATRSEWTQGDWKSPYFVDKLSEFIFPDKISYWEEYHNEHAKRVAEDLNKFGWPTLGKELYDNLLATVLS